MKAIVQLLDGLNNFVVEAEEFVDGADSNLNP